MSALEVPDLRTERLRLVVPTARLAPSFADYFARNRAHLEPWEPTRDAAFFMTAHWVRALALLRTEFREGKSLCLTMLAADARLDDPESPPPVIGHANFRNIVRGSFHACHLGYSIDREHEGRGLMREALEAALDYVFGPLDLHRVMANYQPTNERSAGLLERLGFEREGFARDYLFLNGAWRDHVLTSKIRPEPPTEPQPK